LDFLNILLIRKQTELRKERQQKLELKSWREQSWMGWLKSWVVPPTTGVDQNSPKEPLSQDNMSSEEKLSLLATVELANAVPLVVQLPPEYVEVHLGFRLNKLKVIVTQDDRRWNAKHSIPHGPKNTILDLQIVRCALSLDSRPRNNGLKVTCYLESLDVYGGDAPRIILHGDDLGNPGFENVPHIIAPRKLKCDNNFLDVIFEMAPLNSNYSQRLFVHGHPLDITYDAPTIEKLTCCFTLPQNVPLQKVQSKVMTTYSNLKAESSTCLKKMICESQDNFEMDIHIEAPCFIIPLTCFTPTVMSVTVVELGAIVITSQLLQI